MNRTGISYVDMSWNPVTGCSPVSAGCANCWAKQRAIQNAAAGSCWYDPADPFKPTFHPGRLGEPMARRKPAIIAVGFMGDLFHPDIPVEDARKIIKAMREANHHAYLILTKRPERISEVLWDKNPDPHIWYGATVESGRTAAVRMRYMKGLAQQGYKVWISAEPLLADLDQEVRLEHWFQCPRCQGKGFLAERHIFCDRCGGTGFEPEDKRIGWVIVGCESGPGRRPMNEDWARKILNECARCRVPFFLKQMQVGNKVQAHPAPALDGRTFEQVPRAILEHVGRL